MKTFDYEERNREMEEEEKLKKDIEKVEEGLWVKLEKYGKKISFTKDIRALYRYMKDRDVAWYRKSIVVAALLYFIFPIDAIPDITPLVGYLDDMGVIIAVVKYLGSELIPYYE
ncbi:MAG: YkvA family protein [bacterium]